MVGDEINRASPKTQSALLECMEERQVTVDGLTYELQTPFMVIATQNPIEMEGTYPLPEAQRDRFTARIAMGYPDADRRAGDARRARRRGPDPRPRGRSSDAAIVRQLIETVRDVHVADAVKQYAVNLCTATRESPDLRLGASPRATLQLLRTGRAVAALEGRDYVVPDDLQALAVPVLAHRIIPTAEAQLAGVPPTRSWPTSCTACRCRPTATPRSPYHEPSGAAAGRPVTNAVRPAEAITVREALRGLTGRGRCFLYGAAAAALCALILGENDLLRIAVLLAALPLLAAWNVGRSRYRLACTRVLEPNRVQVGMTARVLLRLENLSSFTTGTLLLEDRLPYALGSRPRLVLERLARRHASSVAYTVRADVRGRFEVGPLVVRLTDPFGLCELTRSFPSVDHLVVIPQVVPLPMVRLAGEYAGAGESHARSVAVHGEDDAATREYRHGDDLRRVHWRSTARTGELMVRREEQPWESPRDDRAGHPRLGAPRRGPDGELRVGGVRGRRASPSTCATPATRCGWSPTPAPTSTRSGGDTAHPRPPGRGAAVPARRPRPSRSTRSGTGPTAAWSSRCSALLDDGRGGTARLAAAQRHHLRRLHDQQYDLAEPADRRPRGGRRTRTPRPGSRCCAAAGGSSTSRTAPSWPPCGRRSAAARRASPWRAAMAETVAGGVR